MSAERIQVAAVTSLMVTAATCAFAWSLTRWVDSLAMRYTVPLAVFGTVWILTVAFASGVAWTAAEQVGTWAAQPKPPTPPPPQPGDQHRPKPAPIQPRPPKPPRQEAAAETTLVDMEPVCEVTREIPVYVEQLPDPVGYVQVPRHVPPEQLLSGDWRPPVSGSARENRQKDAVA